MTVRLSAGPLELGPPRRRAVLALLLVNAGKIVSISSIVRSIWETEPPDHAVATLQSYVSRLRKLIASQPLYGGAELQLKYRSPGYVLNATPDHVDVMRFEQTVKSGLVAQRRGEQPEAFGLLSEALRLWTAPPYEDLADYNFAAQEAARLDHLRLTALEGRAEAAFALGRSEEVLPELEKEAAHHPMRERLVYQLMRAQYGNGQQADALYLFERTRQYLADELGADIGPELRRVHEEILRQDPSLAPSPDAPASPFVTRSTEQPIPAAEPVAAAGQHDTPEPPAHCASHVIVGRQDELRRLLAAAEAAHRGDGRAVLVVGEAGVGKTSLVQEFACLCQKAGTDVLTVYCPQRDDMPPYWPWTQVLRRAATRFPAAVRALPDSTRRMLASFVPELDPEPAADDRPQPPEPGRFEFHDAMSQALLGLARRPLVLVLEDFQWADAASLSLLRFLTSQLAESRLLLTVTSRTFRIADDPDLRATRAAVLQLVNAEEIQLGAVALEDIEPIVTAARGCDVGPDLYAALYERSGGNPYFLLWLVESLPHGATAEEVHGLLPTVIREVVTERLSALPPDILRVLDACVDRGPDSAHGAVEDVVSGDQVSSQAVHRAVRGGLLAVDGKTPERVDFVHPLIRDVVRQELTWAEPLRRAVCSLADTAPEPDAVTETTSRQVRIAPRVVPSTAVIVETENSGHWSAHCQASDRLR